MELSRVHCRFCGQTFFTDPGAEKCDFCGKVGGLNGPGAAPAPAAGGTAAPAPAGAAPAAPAVTGVQREAPAPAPAPPVPAEPREKVLKSPTARKIALGGAGALVLGLAGLLLQGGLGWFALVFLGLAAGYA